MGKGDRRTKRGKIWRGTFGNSRLHKVVTPVPDPKKAKPKAKKAAPKKKAKA